MLNIYPYNKIFNYMENRCDIEVSRIYVNVLFTYMKLTTKQKRSPTLRKRKRKCTTLGLIIDFLFDSSNCTVGGQIQSRSWFQLSLSLVRWMGHDSIIVKR